MNAADAVNALPREPIEPEKKPQAQRLVELIPDQALFRSTDGETAYATIPVDGHRETWPLRSKGFRRWLIGCFYLTEGKPPSSQALTDALSTLEARAQFGSRVDDEHEARGDLLSNGQFVWTLCRASLRASCVRTQRRCGPILRHGPANPTCAIVRDHSGNHFLRR